MTLDSEGYWRGVTGTICGYRAIFWSFSINCGSVPVIHWRMTFPPLWKTWWNTTSILQNPLWKRGWKAHETALYSRWAYPKREWLRLPSVASRERMPVPFLAWIRTVLHFRFITIKSKRYRWKYRQWSYAAGPRSGRVCSTALHWGYRSRKVPPSEMPSTRARNIRCFWQTLTAWSLGQKAGLECKTVSPFSADKWADGQNSCTLHGAGQSLSGRQWLRLLVHSYALIFRKRAGNS